MQFLLTIYTDESTLGRHAARAEREMMERLHGVRA